MSPCDLSIPLSAPVPRAIPGSVPRPAALARKRMVVAPRKQNGDPGLQVSVFPIVCVFKSLALSVCGVHVLYASLFK